MNLRGFGSDDSVEDAPSHAQGISFSATPKNGLDVMEWVQVAGTDSKLVGCVHKSAQNTILCDVSEGRPVSFVRGADRYP